MRNLDKKFDKYLDWIDEQKVDLLTPEEIRAFEYHWYRFAVSIGLMDMFYGNQEMKVLELGGEDVSTKLIKKYFPKWEICNYSDDLRDENWPLRSDSFDLILNMEVVEHLTDQYLGKVGNSEYCYDYNGKFIYSGILNCLKECNRILKKNGKMFLSTPNGLSYLNLFKMLQGEPPYQWLNHIREYSLVELEEIFQKSGWRIDDFECVEVLCCDWDFSYLDDVFNLTNADKSNRWSNFFFNLSVNKKFDSEKIIKKNDWAFSRKISSSLSRKDCISKDIELANRNKKIDRLKTDLEKSQNVISEVTVKLHQRDLEFGMLEEKYSELSNKYKKSHDKNKEIVKLKHDLKKSQNVTSEITMKLSQKSLQFDQLNTKYSELSNQYFKISNSLSWKVTAPLRFIRKLLLKFTK